MHARLLPSGVRYPVCAALVALLAAAAAAHPGFAVSLRIEISDEEVRYDMLLSADFMNYLTMLHRVNVTLPKFEDGRYVFADPAQQDQAAAGIRQIFADENPVMIDGVLVKPIVRKIEFVQASGGVPGAEYLLPPDVRIVLSYPGKGRPRDVSLVWTLFPQDVGRQFSSLSAAVDIIAELDAYDENRLIAFKKNEPEYIWHDPGRPASQRVQPVLASAQVPTLPVPIASAAFVLVALVVPLALRKAAGRKRAVAFFVPLAAAGVAWPLAVVHVPAPWQSAARPPDVAEAKRIFESLQRNVYRAFDYKTESDIYDVLKQSVDGPLLDEVYTEVYQSLIMRDQGGAVARVKDVEILGADVVSAGALPGSRAPAVQLESRWRVRGTVYHWGHVHNRTNEYSARYTIAQRGDTWKITGVEVLTQRRIVTPDDDPEVGTPPPA